MKIAYTFDADKQLQTITYYFVDNTKTTVSVRDLSDELKAELLTMKREHDNFERYERRRKTQSLTDFYYIENNAPSIEDELIRFETHKYFELALKKILPEQRDLIYKIYYLKLSAAEIARSENVSKMAISRRLNRAKSALQNELLRFDDFDFAA